MHSGLLCIMKVWPVWEDQKSAFHSGALWIASHCEVLASGKFNAFCFSLAMLHIVHLQVCQVGGTEECHRLMESRPVSQPPSK